jgi:hypothetical protein
MAKARREKTLADYAVIAISPALIMLLVGSLVFFLLEATYGGQWEGRLRWILFWFVFASVLVARIAIVEGSQYAAIYGLVLAGATSLVIFQFVDFALGALCLLGVVWWSTNKLTWDCTLIDESEDASGEGLLQAAGLDEKTATASEDEADAIEPAEKSTVWESIASGGSKKRNKPHAPGLWVVYFALAALPLFGVGQLLIPVAEAGRRRYALQLLAVYVAASLALLMTTSFLGLRRYLRQRRMQMPGSIVGTWLGVGAVLIVLVLGVSILLPRPNAEYSATAMLDELAGKDRQASWFDLLGGEGAEGEGQRTGEGEDGEPGENDDDQQDGGGEEKGENGEGGQEQEKDGAKGNGQGKDGEGGDGEKDDEQNGGDGNGDAKGNGEQQGGEEGGEEGKEGEKGEDNAEQGEQQAGDDQARNHPPPPSSDAASSSMAWLANAGKWLIYLLIAIGVGWYVIRNRARLFAALRQLWQQLMNLFSRSAADARDDDAQPSEEFRPPPRPFASYNNPFLSGAADGMHAAALVIYTFEALEAWAYEQHLKRPAEQTPIEFGSTLSDRYPDMSTSVAHACRLYARVAYSETIPGRSATAKLEQLWQHMSATERTMSGTMEG